jgi:protein-S-isoprenylcysteine O-methyltransferase Ste14
MGSLLVRNLFFTILQPGIVVVLIPYFILGDKVNTIFTEPFGIQQVMSAIIFFIGFLIMTTCILRFAFYGRGTLSPADPTKQLITVGLYKYSRNPMYIGVLLMLIGLSVLFGSNSLGMYTMFVFISFNIFIVFFEEPRLRKDFGEDYMNYCKRVRRWI